RPGWARMITPALSKHAAPGIAVAAATIRATVDGPGPAESQPGGTLAWRDLARVIVSLPALTPPADGLFSRAYTSGSFRPARLPPPPCTPSITGNERHADRSSAPTIRTDHSHEARSWRLTGWLAGRFKLATPFNDNRRPHSAS